MIKFLYTCIQCHTKLFDLACYHMFLWPAGYIGMVDPVHILMLKWCGEDQDPHHNYLHGL